MTVFSNELGSSLPKGTLQVTVFIPSVDRVGDSIDQKYWREATLELLGTLFRGATAFPPGRGVWRDDARGGELVYDDTVLVTSYADPAALNQKALMAIRKFLHRLGREANQGEVGIVIGGNYYGVQDYDPEEE